MISFYLRQSMTSGDADKCDSLKCSRSPMTSAGGPREAYKSKESSAQPQG